MLRSCFLTTPARWWISNDLGSLQYTVGAVHTSAVILTAKLLMSDCAECLLLYNKNPKPIYIYIIINKNIFLLQWY